MEYEADIMSNIITVQGEPDNTLKRGDMIYFSTRIPIDHGEIVTLSNHSKTINTRVKITDSSRPFYGAQCVYDYDVANRLDLIKIG